MCGWCPGPVVPYRTWTMNKFLETGECELSLDPEVATLFGREIGQSNGDILLTDDEPVRIKVD